MIPLLTTIKEMYFVDTLVNVKYNKPLKTLPLCLYKTHGSESRGQEEAGLRDEPVSYLQVAPLLTC